MPDPAAKLYPPTSPPPAHPPTERGFVRTEDPWPSQVVDPVLRDRQPEGARPKNAGRRFAVLMLIILLAGTMTIGGVYAYMRSRMSAGLGGPSALKQPPPLERAGGGWNQRLK